MTTVKYLLIFVVLCVSLGNLSLAATLPNAGSGPWVKQVCHFTKVPTSPDGPNRTDYASCSAFVKATYTGFNAGYMYGLLVTAQTTHLLDSKIDTGKMVNSVSGAVGTIRGCPPTKVATSQLVFAVSRYVHEQPRQSGIDGWHLVLNAIKAAWPCHSKQHE